MENVAKELECIMKSGFFELIITPKQGLQVELEERGDADSNSKILLYYEPVRELHVIKNRAKTLSLTESCDGAVPFSPPHMDTQVSSFQEVWNREQIDDFVRKLGFLESHKVEEQVKAFQLLNQVC